MKYVYLAGPIAGLTFDAAKEWRENFQPPEGWEALSPMRGKDYVPGILTDKFDAGAAAVAQDLTDIDQCDAVIVNVTGAERVSVGTMAEMGYAFARGKPIILVGKLADSPHDHVFVDYMSSYDVRTLTTATMLLQEEPWLPTNTQRSNTENSTQTTANRSQSSTPKVPVSL